MNTAFEAPTWWSSLKHGGLLIAPSRLGELASGELEPLSSYETERLRTGVIRMLDGDRKHLPDLLDTVLEGALQINSGGWSKGPEVDPSWSRPAVTGEAIKPRRLWQGPHGTVLPVFDAAVGAGRSSELPPRLGIGRGRRTVTRVVEWLRKSDQKLALLTNGRQWRLIHAGLDYDAWCEWDIDFWFEEGQLGPQTEALRRLLGVQTLTPSSADEPSPLLQAVLASRKGQAELSAVLGERVRLAVEHLVQESSLVLAPLDKPGPDRVSRRDLYIAATRVIMRCVVLLFAEARDLLPRDEPAYNDSYGLQGLRDQLERRSGGRALERLRHAHGAWPRLVALFRLVYQGSTHQALPVPRYGGDLFRPGTAESADPILRAVAALENPQNTPSDAAVYRILERLTRSRVKVRQGVRSTWVDAPVDFSDLSSEYIGILYEGLLDFELRRAESDQPIVFLNVGNQPALPLERLDAMSTKDMKELFEKLKKDVKSGPAAVEEEKETTEEVDEEAAEAEEESEEPPEEEEDEEESEPEEAETDADQRRLMREMVEIWARKAVRAAKLVKYPKDDTDPRVRARHEEDEATAARGLIHRVVMPGEWFLVRWGGTRKGSGTFYTRPQLASPTTRRTLQPLAYDSVAETTDPDTGLVTVTEWRPKTPEEILALKVCDPAMGSGSFLVSALRFLTDALFESLHFHRRFDPRGDGTIVRLADGLPVDHPSQETLPLPQDHADFDEYLRARLKRHIVERCLYGVDLDPLAVELGRMALWVETMDRRLPFGFLDHKLKCGNSLVGGWFDRFQDYPVMAWEREGGDKNHDRFVNHFREFTPTRGKKKGQTLKKGDKWTQAIKDMKAGSIKPKMAGAIQEPGRMLLAEQLPAADLHDQALAALEELHALPVHETQQREELYREKILGNADFQRLKLAFDTWCAVWFWPGKELEQAPTPLTLLDPPEETQSLVEKVAAVHRFFHWELEFPDVFAREGSGFDALIGNPPWEIQKPNSKEFFSNIDPLYRTYGKQEALRRQTEYFKQTTQIEEDWIDYCARLKALSNWTKHAAAPWGDPEEGDRFSFSRSGKANEELHRLWRERRRSHHGYADPEHPFRHQGSADINTYKMFLEEAHALAREKGFFGFLTPSGIYTDKGSTELRELFLSQCSWQWLFGFENREGIFDIHRSFKFGPVIVQKGGETTAIRAAFMHRDLQDWEEAERHVLAYPRERVEQFSPNSKAILEIRSERDLEVLSKLYANGVLLGDQGPDGWGIKYAREFDMTNDSRLFPPRPKWEEKGYCSDEYGHWLKGGWQPYNGPKSILQRPRDLVLSVDSTQAIKVTDIEDVALPLYQGIMVHQYDATAKRWISGTGLNARWEPITAEAKCWAPQYLMGSRNWQECPGSRVGLRFGYREVARSTDTRSVIGAALAPFPCGHKVPVLSSQKQGSIAGALVVAAVMNSLTFDWLVRAKLGATALAWFVLQESVVPFDSPDLTVLSAAALNLIHKRFALEWVQLGKSEGLDSLRCASWLRHWAVTVEEQLRRRCVIEALVADEFGIDVDDLALIVSGCDHPSNWISSAGMSDSRDAKGFWRVDKGKDPELRHTVLSLVAFHDLKERGLKAFLEQNDGEGWMLPETLRLADYGLGHDDRAKQPQPVASRLGPRFYDWQLEQSVEESWEECERHAELLQKIVPPAHDAGAAKKAAENSARDEKVQKVLFDDWGKTI